MTVTSNARQQAEATRSAIVEAARGLFLSRGYSGTTIEAIAAAANVASITVYATFGGKRGILDRVIATALVGDEDAVPLLEREGPQAVVRDTDQRRQVTQFATGIAAIMERVSPIFEVMRNAAPSEPEVAQLLETLLRERMHGMRLVVEAIARNGPLLEGVSVETATQTTWALSSPDLHRLLTVRLRWNSEQYGEWLARMLSRALLAEGMTRRSS
jgi:AcrR family transcriptional regulator